MAVKHSRKKTKKIKKTCERRRMSFAFKRQVFLTEFTRANRACKTLCSKPWIYALFTFRTGFMSLPYVQLDIVKIHM